MTIDGVRDILNDLQEGGGLDDFELESVEQSHVDNMGRQQFRVNISYGPLVYRLTSYIPPTAIRRHIVQLGSDRLE